MDDLSISSGVASRFWRIALWGCVFAILLVPLIAMQFSGEVHWTLGDFAVAAGLLGITALAVELAMRACTGTILRVTAVLVVLSIFILVWAELAVGVLGTPFAGS